MATEINIIKVLIGGLCDNRHNNPTISEHCARSVCGTCELHTGKGATIAIATKEQLIDFLDKLDIKITN